MAEMDPEETELYHRVMNRSALASERSKGNAPIPAQIYFYRKALQDFLERSVSSTMEERVTLLEKEVHELKRLQFEKKRTTRADMFYEKHKEKLEKEHFGEVVALDPDSGAICGMGSSILEAYEKAHEKTGKARFYYRKIGHPFFCKIR